MTATDNTISPDMLDSLKGCKGGLLKTVLCTDTGNPVRLTSYGVVVLRFKNFDVELWNEEQPDIPGKLPDLAKIRIDVNVDQNVKSPLGQKDESGKFVPGDFFPLEINKTIDGIMIQNEKVKCFDGKGAEQFELDNTRAIVISLGGKFLHIGKVCSWSEMWDISLRKTILPEESSEWGNDDGSSYEVHSYFLDL
ncbi:MAG: hypothetical protein MJ025_02515 [Victivallaceae bacterium]|nr:hypothetical protein [Victivallaceae bacterium]